MKKFLALTTVGFCFAIAFTPRIASTALYVSMNPTSISWDSNTWVDVWITNSGGSGFAANLTLGVDADGNGSTDPQDLLLEQFELIDGQTNRFGAVTIPADADGLTNGIIHARVPFFGISNPMHTVGKYLWQIAYANGTSETNVPFSVTQPTSTVYITGRVVDYAAANPIAAAYVEAVSFGNAKGNPPATWTDTNGEFRIDLPDAFSTADVEGVQCVAFDHFNMTRREDTEEWISAYLFENDLSTGANALTNDLRAVPAVPDRVHTLSGTLYDDQTNPISCAIISFEESEEDGNDGDDPGQSITVTDTDGNFRLPVPDGVIGGVGVDAYFLNMRGYVASSVGPYTVTNDIGDIRVFCPRATILARSTVTVKGTGTGVEGVEVEFDAGSFWNSGISIADGMYEVGLTPNSAYEADVSDDGLAPLGYARVNGYEDLSITNEGVFTNAPFEVERAYALAGVVYDQNTNALTDGEVQIVPFGGWGGDNGNVNRHGTYLALAATGTYRVTAQDFEGYIAQVYSNHFTWEWDNGPVADPVTVTTNGATNINFFLPQASYIRGTVFGTDTPLANANVSVNVGNEGRDETQTDTNGTYELAVLAGTNYTVQAQGPDGSFFLYQYWSNKTQNTEADLVATDTNAPATNINFNLLVGMRIEGQAWNELGVPMESLRIEGFRFDTNGWWIWCGGDDTDADGGYGFAVPAGTSYFVRASRPWTVSEDDWWYPNTFFSNKFSDSSSDQVQAGPSATVSHVDFHLAPGYRVEGFVYDSDGASPVTNGYVESLDAATNRYDNTPCEGDGSYRLCLPNHLPLILHGTAEDRAPEYYDNVYSAEQATAIQPTAMTTTRVDFALYTWTEDHDSDCVPDFQEDTRPDGIYKDAEDWASYTNNDTDADLVVDQDEQNRSTSPKLADTDGDTFSDYQEIYITLTDPTATFSGSNSYLRCAQTVRNGSNVVINWSAAVGVTYWIQRSTNLLNGSSWNDLMGPLVGTGDVMTATDSNAPSNSAYRVQIPYTPL